MSQKCLLIYTGGTIGSVQTPQGYAPSTEFRTLLRQRLQALDEDTAESFDFMALDQLIDSANLQITHWSMIGTLLAQNWQNYAGFVVLHGTDTMSYTAAALSFLFAGQNKPIIVTGSQIPLSETHNDALNNLLGALHFASDTRLNETCIYFNHHLLRGNRARKTDSAAMAAFDSPNYPHLGRMNIQAQLNTPYLMPVVQEQTTLPSHSTLQNFATQAAASVVMCLLYPGMPASQLSGAIVPKQTQAFILLSYGAGNIPSENPAWVEALQQIAAQGILIVNLTQCSKGTVSQGSYAAGHALNQMGAIPGMDMTPEAAFAKLQVLIAQGYQKDALKQRFTQDICGELSAHE